MILVACRGGDELHAGFDPSSVKFERCKVCGAHQSGVQLPLTFFVSGASLRESSGKEPRTFCSGRSADEWCEGS